MIIDLVWMVTAVIETSEGSALHRDETMGICTDPDAAKVLIGELYPKRLLWMMKDNEYICFVGPSKAVNSEPIIQWIITPIQTNKLQSVNNHD